MNPSAPDKESSRRGFFQLTLGWLSAIFAMTASTAGAVRFLVPNVLFEPDQRFKAGKLDDYLDGSPLFDCFTNAPDFTVFDAVTNQVPLDKMNPNPKHIGDATLRKDAYVSAKLPLDNEDQCPEDLFNYILWRAMKGSSTPYPDWAVKTTGDDD